MPSARRNIAAKTDFKVKKPELFDVVRTWQLYQGCHAYMHDPKKLNELRLPASYGALLCDGPAQDPALLVGELAVVCLGVDRLVFAKAEEGCHTGECDLYDPYRDGEPVMRGVSPYWAAPLVCGISEKHWRKMVGWGHVQSITASLH